MKKKLSFVLIALFVIFLCGCSNTTAIEEPIEIKYEKVFLDGENAYNYLSINNYFSDGVCVFTHVDENNIYYYNFSCVGNITTSKICEYKFINCVVFFEVNYSLVQGLNEPIENPTFSATIDINGNSHCSHHFINVATSAPLYPFSNVNDITALIYGYVLKPINNNYVY